MSFNVIWNVCYWILVLPIIGANRHEFPINGSSFGPGMLLYGFAADIVSITISVWWSNRLFANLLGSSTCSSLGSIFMADENVVLLANDVAAARVPISIIKQAHTNYTLLLCLQFSSKVNHLSYFQGVWAANQVMFKCKNPLLFRANGHEKLNLISGNEFSILHYVVTHL